MTRKENVTYRRALRALILYPLMFVLFVGGIVAFPLLLIFRRYH